MSIAIAGIIGVSKGYGGFETLAEHLIDGESPVTTVYCSSKYFETKVNWYKNTSLVYLPLDSKGFQKIFHTGISMFHAGLSGHKTLLLLGVSGGLALPLIRVTFPKTKIVTNMDGLEWQRGKWNFFIRKILKFSEYLSCKFSHVIIADNEVLVKYVEKNYGKTPTMIAYGGDHALVDNSHSAGRSAKFNAFALCRIVPENNVHMILDGFSRSGKELTFVGNWDSSDYGRKLRSQYSCRSNITILDPIFDLSLLFDLRSKSHVYVHGHSVGGTNPALVEMMHFGKPILAFDCSYNRATMEGNGRFFATADDLSKLLDDAEYLEASCSGDVFKEIADRRYTWSIVRRGYFDVLDSVVSK